MVSRFCFFFKRMVLFCSFKSGSSTQGKDIFLPVRGNSVCLMVWTSLVLKGLLLIWAGFPWFLGFLCKVKEKKKISTHVLESTFSHWHSYLEFVMYDMHYCKCITRHGHLFFYTPIGLMLCLMNLSTCYLFALNLYQYIVS